MTERKKKYICREIEHSRDGVFFFLVKVFYMNKERETEQRIIPMRKR